MAASRSVESDPAGHRVLNAAAATAGPAEVLEFLLPLWAGAVLGASATETGLLVAAGALAAFVARVPLGAVADRADRLLVAAGGAALAVVGLLGIAAVEVTGAGLGPAFAVVAVFGVAGAAVGVGVRSWLAEQYGGDVDAYGVLLTAESQGAGVAYIVAFLLLGALGYPAVFALGAAACVLGTLLLLSARRHDPRPSASRGGTRSTRPPRPVLGLLALCVVNAAVQSAVVLLLVLHLQRTEQLGVYQIAYVLAPGLVAFILAPRAARPISDRIGPGGTLAVSLAVTAVLAAGLATSPGPVLCAVLWALAAAALAVATPVEQAVLAGTADARVGRAMSRYEMAGLLGATLGSAAAGALFDLGNLPLPALAAAVVLLLTAALAPRVVRAAGPITTRQHTPVHGQGTSVASPAPSSPAPADPTPPAPASTRPGGPDMSHGRPHSRHLLRTWLIHVAVFAVGQTLLGVFGHSWLWELVGGPGAAEGWITFLGRIWVVAFLVDTAIVMYRQFVPKTAPV